MRFAVPFFAVAFVYCLLFAHLVADEGWRDGMLGAAVLSYMPVILQVFEHWRLEVHGAIILGVMAVRPQGVLEHGLIADLRVLWRRLRAAVTASGTSRVRGDHEH